MIRAILLTMLLATPAFGQVLWPDNPGNDDSKYVSNIVGQSVREVGRYETKIWWHRTMIHAAGEAALNDLALYAIGGNLAEVDFQNRTGIDYLVVKAGNKFDVYELLGTNLSAIAPGGKDVSHVTLYRIVSMPEPSFALWPLLGLLRFRRRRHVR